MSKNQLIKNGTSESEELYFFKKNKELIDVMHEKQSDVSKDKKDNLIPLFKEKKRVKKAA